MIRSRRALLTGSATALAALSLPLAADDLIRPVPDEPTLVIGLWPSKPPGGEKVTVVQEVWERQNQWNLRDRAIRYVTRPTLSVFRPVRPNGASVLVIPGGGYAHTVVDKEGFETARWLAARGVTAFVLLYRLPHQGWAAGPDTPLQDAQRALRLIRARAAEYGLDPARVAVQGFSAGGHLAATLLTRFERRVYEPVDGADALPARPDLGCLVYPVISMKAGISHPGSRANMLGPDPTPEREAEFSPDMNVTAGVPPTWILHAADDQPVPVENALLIYAALRKAGVPAAMHLFEEGGHGFGLRGIQDTPLQVWPQLFLDWAARHGLMGPAGSGAIVPRPKP
ncbi:MAG TPA: alpha/beta hydrolase [Azospirillaceae bacterium]|nr:alpha/beta hydrolase [Azospirillaceae bacterium]